MFQNTLRMLFIALLTLFSACSNHVHEEDGHGHEHGGISITQWNDKTEIFMEYPPLVVGKEAAFAIHLSNMGDFKPVTEGTLECETRVLKKGRKLAFLESEVRLEDRAIARASGTFSIIPDPRIEKSA